MTLKYTKSDTKSFHTLFGSVGFLENHPDYQPLSNKIMELSRRHIDLIQQRVDIEKRLATLKPSNSLDEKAAALVFDDQELPPEIENLEQELRQTSQKIRITEQAELLARQELEKCQNKISIRVCQNIQPSYRQNIRKLISLQVDTWLLEQAFNKARGDLEMAGYSIDSLVLPWGFYKFGHLSDPSSCANILIQEWVKEGFLSQEAADCIRDGYNVMDLEKNEEPFY